MQTHTKFGSWLTVLANKPFSDRNAPDTLSFSTALTLSRVAMDRKSRDDWILNTLNQATDV